MHWIQLVQCMAWEECSVQTGFGKDVRHCIIKLGNNTGQDHIKRGGWNARRMDKVGGFLGNPRFVEDE